MTLQAIRNRWEKNWPDIRCAISAGFPAFVFARNPTPLDDGIPVFCYHQVTADSFERDLQFLRDNGYRTATADDLLAHLRKETVQPPGTVVLTVDDGALTLYRVIYPLLKRYDQRAVAFIATCFHDDTADRMPAAARPCAWTELREMHASGHVDIQSHTHEHRHIPRWPAPLELVGIDDNFAQSRRSDPLTIPEDLARARQILETRLEKPVRHLAWPRYDTTPEADRLARSCGYEGLWTGARPHRRGNRPGDPAEQIVRISGEFLRRLPGPGRVSLSTILRARLSRQPL